MVDKLMRHTPLSTDDCTALNALSHRLATFSRRSSRPSNPSSFGGQSSTPATKQRRTLLAISTDSTPRHAPFCARLNQPCAVRTNCGTLSKASTYRGKSNPRRSTYLGREPLQTSGAASWPRGSGIVRSGLHHHDLNRAKAARCEAELLNSLEIRVARYAIVHTEIPRDRLGRCMRNRNWA
jgi:hypothetical protein